MSSQFNTWLQSRLTSHGFACGAIDGDIGPKTLRALRAFEESRGLKADGTADPVVVKALRATSSAISTQDRADIPDRDDDNDPAIQAIDLVPPIWPRQRDVPGVFGNVGTQQTTIEIPFDMRLAWDTSARATKMTLHELVAGSALRALHQIAAVYSTKERADLGIDRFAGSLNVRRMWGGSRYSMHSWGIAIDFDSLRNPFHAGRPRARLSHQDALPFWAAWEGEGWLSLGRARDFDWMHVQAARL